MFYINYSRKQKLLQMGNTQSNPNQQKQQQQKQENPQRENTAPIIDKKLIAEQLQPLQIPVQGRSQIMPKYNINNQLVNSNPLLDVFNQGEPAEFMFNRTVHEDGGSHKFSDIPQRQSSKRSEMSQLSGLTKQSQSSRNMIRIQYTNGDTFEGNINQQKQRDGQGTYICADRKRSSGYEYQGHWKENARDGRSGKCFYYNEEFYIGDWQQDSRHGQGEHFYKYNEERYLGDWRYDMRYGKGTLMSNGGTGSQGSSGGQHHYEGKFKEDVRHGRGILKVTQNYQRYSTKQKEVKVYEQEWRNGKLVYQKKIHTVCGEDQIANLLLNTEFINYVTYKQVLLQLYHRTPSGQLNMQENLQKYKAHNSIFDKPIQNQQNCDSTQPFIRKVGPSEATDNKRVYDKKSQDRFREMVMRDFVGFPKVSDPAQQQVPEVQLSKLQKDKLSKLLSDIQNDPENAKKWTTAELLSFLNDQNIKNFQIILDTFIEIRIDGPKFFQIKNEAEMLKVTGIQALGVRKNLMRYIKKLNNLQNQIEQAEIERQRLEQEFQKNKLVEQQRDKQKRKFSFFPQSQSTQQRRNTSISRPHAGLQIDTGESIENGLIMQDMPQPQTCRSQNDMEANPADLNSSPNQQPPGSGGRGYFKSGISNVHAAVSGAFSGLSAYYYGTSQKQHPQQQEGGLEHLDADAEQTGFKQDDQQNSPKDQNEDRKLDDRSREESKDHLEFLDFDQNQIDLSQQDDSKPIITESSLLTSSIFVQKVENSNRDLSPNKDSALPMMQNQVTEAPSQSQIVAIPQNRLAQIEISDSISGIQCVTQSAIVMQSQQQNLMETMGGLESQYTMAAIQQTQPPETPFQNQDLENPALQIQQQKQPVGDAMSPVMQNEDCPQPSQMKLMQPTFQLHIAPVIAEEDKQTLVVQNIDPKLIEESKSTKLEPPPLNIINEDIPVENKSMVQPPECKSPIVFNQSPNREGAIISSRSNAKPSRPLSSQSNDQFLLQTVRRGVHGLNLQKVRQNCKLPDDSHEESKSSLQEQSKLKSGANKSMSTFKNQRVAYTPGDMSAFSNFDDRQSSQRKMFAKQQTILQNQTQQHIPLAQSQRSKKQARKPKIPRIKSENAIYRETGRLDPGMIQDNTLICDNDILASSFALDRNQAYPLPPWAAFAPGLPMGRDLDQYEEERRDKEEKERQKQVEMSKNLIDILFQTEKDREREKFKREKEKLKNMKIGAGVKTSRGSKSPGMYGQLTVCEPSNRSSALMNNIEKDSDENEAKNLDEDAYLYLIKSFDDNGFSFYIDFHDLKFDYKTDFLGGGGYGEVFKAQWMATPVAVKRFGRKCTSKKSINDFIKEIEIVNQMRHPNIIFFMGVTFDEDNHYYMITEYSSKGSIFDLLHSNTQGPSPHASQAGPVSSSHRGRVILEDSKIFKIIKEMALAIKYLHTKKILHCDLKSQNILLTDDWTVKICDFGLARYQEKFVRENHGKVGTPHWMAPEILRGEKYTEAADVYSYGVILWELVTGEIPHRGRSVPQIVGSVGYHGEKLKLPQESTANSQDYLQQLRPQTKHFRKLINSCTQHSAQKRPTFEHILQYLDHVETQYIYAIQYHQQRSSHNNPQEFTYIPDNQSRRHKKRSLSYAQTFNQKIQIKKNRKNRQFMDYFQKLIEV